jgi:multidrug efflux pump subunit AcrA (membrane-fusion protein)
VKRGTFPISILLSGTLDAIKRHSLSCDIRGGDELKYEKVVEDRTRVRKGEVVAVFSRESFDDTLDTLVLQLEDERKNLILAEQDLAVRKQTDVASIRSAMDALKTAREAKSRYEELDAPKKRKELLAAVNTANDKVEAARKAAKEAETALQEASRESESAQETARKNLETKEKNFEKEETAQTKALHELRVFRQYDYPKKMRGLKEGLAKAKLGLQKALTETKGSLIKAETNLQNFKLRIKQKEERIAELKEKIEKLVIRAPVDGIVSHGDPHRPHWRQPQEVKVGAVTRPRRTFASIPDLSRFLVKVDVPESHRSNVRIGLKAILTTPALPKLKMQGEVSEIAPMARNVIHWDKNSPKIYETKIDTDARDKRLMPGMTVEVEVIVETVENALYVPVEALYNREGKVYCRVSTLTGPEEREVDAGRASSNYVEVLSGLNEAEQVFLYRQEEGKGENQ